jgi:aspartate aminotransferase-like enzyme
MDENGADVVAGSSRKCLELPPGLAPVADGERAWNWTE